MSEGFLRFSLIYSCCMSRCPPHNEGLRSEENIRFMWNIYNLYIDMDLPNLVYFTDLSFQANYYEMTTFPDKFLNDAYIKLQESFMDLATKTTANWRLIAQYKKGQ